MATVPEAAQPKPSISQSVTLNFDHMTWSDLRQFVGMADQAFVDGGETVTLAWDESDSEDPYAPPIGLTFSVLAGGG